MNPLTKSAAYLTYIFLHLTLPIYSLLRWRLLPFFIRHIRYFLLFGFDGINLTGVRHATRNLGKVPQHIVFVFDEHKDPINSASGLRSISLLIGWAIASGIPFISIFDTNGKLKKCSQQLVEEVEHSSFLMGKVARLKGMNEAEGKAKQCRVDKDVVPDLFRLRSELCLYHPSQLKNGTVEGQTFTVKMLSAADGRADIVRTVQSFCRDGVQPTDLTVESFQKAMPGFGGLPDPNLMLKFDGTSVMPLFPPWQMSLTEILDVGTLKDLTWPNFLSCLQWYSRSVQRLGK